jgi:peptidoglycan glycosyltransferase
MLRVLFRFLALAASLALAWVGLAASDDTWRLLLIVILLLLVVAFWPRRQEEETPLGHNVRLFGALLLAAGMLLGLQLLRLQVLQAETIRAQVANLPDGPVQNIRPYIAERRTQRGRIYDRNGTLLADTTVTADGWAQRTYTRADLGYIVGFYNPVYGNAGLEATYDDYLAGRVGEDPMALFIEELLHRSRVGDDLYLTLDVGLQEAAQAAYEQVTAEVLGDQCPEGQCPGSVVLVDVRTGAILALYAYPRFDPRPLVFDPAAEDWDAEQERITLYWQSLVSDTAAPLVDRATNGLYPPGSTFKTFTAASMLETGLATPDTIITCPEHYTVTGHVVVNAVSNLAANMQKQNLLEDFQWSCNTAFAQMGLMLGGDRFSEYAKRFGLTYRALAPARWPDLVDLPAAVPTVANDRAFLDRETAVADSSYGQGQVSVTPLYMAMLAATIANDGMMMRPYMVERVVAPDGQVRYEAEPTLLRVPIGRQTARTMNMLMVNAVDNGYGWRAKIDGVKVAGKTGTAEPGTGDPHGWFIAFAPADNPRYAVAVVVEHGGHGSRIAAPIAKLVLEAALGR